ncbi:MAG TPA: hypothetical protein VEH27_04635 [Methylomirabilota bacterium]|nr:hypothetical protein [Methylomirabilota bacterium]
MKRCLVFLFGLFVSSLSLFAQHGHLNAGAVGTNQNDQLIWANGAAFAATSGFVRTMVYTNAGRFADTYNQNITLTALPRTVTNGGPTANAPALGSLIVAEIVSVNGPEGGAFQFWDSDSPAGQPALAIPSGTSNGTFRYFLSDRSVGAGTKEADPYGHLHGRRFGVTRPGRYTVGFRAVDISTNGNNSGPIHLPSDVLEINFQTVTAISRVQKDGDAVKLTFKAEPEARYEVEFTDELKGAATVWMPAHASISHTNSYLTLPVPNATGTRRFYRLKVTEDGH